MPNLKHLYYFYIFSQDFSTSKAARRLGISAPALSNQLKQLENFLGVPITKRAKGKVLVTESGAMVLYYAERMFSTYEELRQKLNLNRNADENPFRVGVCQNIGSQFAFDLLSLIAKAHFTDSKNVKITFSDSDSLHDGIRHEQFEMIMGAFQPEPTKNAKLVSQTFTFPVRLFAPSALAQEISRENKLIPGKEPTELIEFANRRNISLVVPARHSVLRRETETFLLLSRVSPARTIECNSSSAIVQLIERGFAMGFVPTPCLLDFKSAAPLAFWGPPTGCWSHGLSAVVQKGKGTFMVKAPPLADMFLP